VPPSPVPGASSRTSATEPAARLGQNAVEQLEMEVQHVASAVH
jgi:hypothetical protein